MNLSANSTLLETSSNLILWLKDHLPAQFLLLQKHLANVILKPGVSLVNTLLSVPLSAKVSSLPAFPDGVLAVTEDQAGVVAGMLAPVEAGVVAGDPRDLKPQQAIHSEQPKLVPMILPSPTTLSGPGGMKLDEAFSLMLVLKLKLTELFTQFLELELKASTGLIKFLKSTMLNVPVMVLNLWFGIPLSLLVLVLMLKNVLLTLPSPEVSVKVSLKELELMFTTLLKC